MIKWQEGRQGTDYFKLPLLISKRFGFDIYLLKYPEMSCVPQHVDPVPNKRHYRLNIVLRRSTAGGYFVTFPDPDRLGVVHKGRFNFFRPDILPHAVAMAFGKTRYVLSIGWVRD